jgi:hypothetical protein
MWQGLMAGWLLWVADELDSVSQDSQVNCGVQIRGGIE